jgi:hypothetical protein
MVRSIPPHVKPLPPPKVPGKSHVGEHTAFKITPATPYNGKSMQCKFLNTSQLQKASC